MPVTAGAESPGGAQITGAGRLRAEISSRPADPYLVTVTPDASPHCQTVTVAWGVPDGELTVAPVPRTWARAEVTGFRMEILIQ